VSQPKSEHVAWLDWLRFLAAFTVVVVHARGSSFVAYGALPDEQKTALVKALFAATRLGNEAVVFFFILSGFLVGGRVIERVAAGTFDWPRYAIDRVTRIYIPLVPALALTVAVAFYIGADVPFTVVIGNFVSLQGVLVPPLYPNVPLWSLAYEVWFYAFAGLAAVTVQKRSSGVFLAAAACLLVFTSLSANLLLCWAMGAMAYVSTPQKRSVVYLTSAALISAVGTIFAQLASESASLPGLNGFAPSENTSNLILAFGLCVFVQQVSLMRLRGPMIAIERLGTHFAAISYTLYLTHYPLLYVTEHLGFGQAPALSLSAFAILLGKIAVMLVVAWIIYLGFEKHTASVRKWITVWLIRAPHPVQPLPQPGAAVGSV
jgi:peptidoglycan/LPS O-acetylase OafA/YrhL